MACPLCGDQCTCSYVSPRKSGVDRATKSQAGAASGAVPHGSATHPSHNEVPDSSASERLEEISDALMIDPEPFEATEEQFSATLSAAPAREPEFQMDANHRARVRYTEVAPDSCPAGQPDEAAPDAAAPNRDLLSPRPGSGIEREFAEREQLETRLEQQSQFWREEVASRVNSYRTRRSRKRLAGEFSMKLNFDPPSGGAAARAAASALPTQAAAAAAPFPEEWPAAIPARAFQQAPELLEDEEDEDVEPLAHRTAESPKVIEFPRLEVASREARPPEWVRDALFYPADELAEPVLDRPRILEAPEDVDIAAPGTISDFQLESDQAEEELTAPPHPNFDLPLKVAPLPLRFTAAMLDWLVVLMGTAGFAMIVMKTAAGIPHTRAALALAIVVPILFWAIYHYLFLVHAGMTPGMEIVNLRMSTFQDTPAPRRARRWRALAMVLSCVSLGLGFIWSLLDEDNLCWHDKVTRTYLTNLR